MLPSLLRRRRVLTRWCLEQVIRAGKDAETVDKTIRGLEIPTYRHHYDTKEL